jgi:hypothetical protein
MHHPGRVRSGYPSSRHSRPRRPFFPFEGGRIVKVEISVGDDAYVDLEQLLAAALAPD